MIRLYNAKLLEPVLEAVFPNSLLILLFKAANNQKIRRQFPSISATPFLKLQNTIATLLQERLAAINKPIASLKRQLEFPRFRKVSEDLCGFFLIYSKAAKAIDLCDISHPKLPTSLDGKEFFLQTMDLSGISLQCEVLAEKLNKKPVIEGEVFVFFTRGLIHDFAKFCRQYKIDTRSLQRATKSFGIRLEK